MHVGRVLAVCLPLACALAQKAQPEPAPTTAAQRAQRFARELELPERRAAACDALLLLGTEAVPALMQQAKHPDLATARVALQVVAALSHDGLTAVPALQELAKGDDPRAQAAAWTLARLPHRGTFLVPLMQQSVVVELDGDGKEIWRSPKIGQAWMASVLANGRLLVAELNGGAREYDAEGKVVIEFPSQLTHVAERLIDGNTLTTSYRKRCVLEFDAAGNEVWSHQDVAALSATRLPNGRTLLGDYAHARVLEVDRGADVTWQADGCSQATACHRRRDGSTWVVSSSAWLLKLDRDGNETGRLQLEKQAYDVVPLPDGSIQCGEGYVRRCDEQGKERWRVNVGGSVGRITLR